MLDRCVAEGVAMKKNQQTYTHVVSQGKREREMRDKRTQTR